MVEFKGLIIGFILFSLFGILLLTTIVDVGTTYNKDSSEIVQGSLGLQNFTNSLNGIQTHSQNLYESFASGNIFSTIAGVIADGIFGVVQDMFAMIFTPFNLLNNILINILGIPAYVTGVIWAIIILIVIFGIWQLIRTGTEYS